MARPDRRQPPPDRTREDARTELQKFIDADPDAGGIPGSFEQIFGGLGVFRGARMPAEPVATQLRQFIAEHCEPLRGSRGTPITAFTLQAAATAAGVDLTGVTANDLSALLAHAGYGICGDPPPCLRARPGAATLCGRNPHDNPGGFAEHRSRHPVCRGLALKPAA